MMGEIKYASQPYWKRWERKDPYPSNMLPLESAPVTSAVPVVIVDARGDRHLCLHYRNEWNKVRSDFDVYTGRSRLTMTGERIPQPVGWVSS